MKILNAIFKRGKIKRLKQEIEFLNPINTYLSYDYLWFDLNWRLVRRLTYYIENMNRNTDELLSALTNEPQSYYLNLIDYVEKNIRTINKYFKDNKSIITFKTFDFEFFEFSFMYIPKLAKKQREAFTNNKLSIARLKEINMLLFFYHEVLLRIQVVDYRIEELKSII
ncbi:hypothetical protein J53TS2_29560 [Paenibacillus sp. J53TS2]|uniref:hypothetical protein n=1 Tax=Paenibacillus sp. J53TS2 TaxID=2807197 RepID=UPI001B1CAAA0|nr:hypothetical protein [Paenibacillus sp. J53TS2]GIP49365.1 hypothetical protein J53TS2_29560 [Paenibacillus sp. J53TS2]